MIGNLPIRLPLSRSKLPLACANNAVKLQLKAVETAMRWGKGQGVGFVHYWLHLRLLLLAFKRYILCISFTGCDILIGLFIVLNNH